MFNTGNDACVWTSWTALHTENESFIFNSRFKLATENSSQFRYVKLHGHLTLKLTPKMFSFKKRLSNFQICSPDSTLSLSNQASNTVGNWTDCNPAVGVCFLWAGWWVCPKTACCLNCPDSNRYLEKVKLEKIEKMKSKFFFYRFSTEYFGKNRILKTPLRLEGESKFWFELPRFFRMLIGSSALPEEFEAASLGAGFSVFTERIVEMPPLEKF